MSTPRLLAIDDVRLTAPPAAAHQVAEFYTQVVGLRLLAPEPEDARLVFCGYSVVKPRLIVHLVEERPADSRGVVQVVVRSLAEVEELIQERGIEPDWTRHLSHFDRRLTILDPAGNRAELVAYHVL